MHPIDFYIMYFDELDLNDNVLDALYDMRFDTCTPIQEKCIPEILKGKDVLGIHAANIGGVSALMAKVELTVCSII